jgi:hypothetical protein
MSTHQRRHVGPAPPLAAYQDLFLALAAGAVPVVMGDLPKEVEAVLPSKTAVIKARDFQVRAL